MPNPTAQTQWELFLNFIKKLWAIPVGFIGAVTMIAQFIELWRGDQATITYIVIGIAFALLLASLLWVAFAYSTSKILLLHNVEKTIRSPLFPSANRFARAGLALLGVLMFGAGLMFYGHLRELNSKTVILITRIDGPDEKNYRVTDILISQIRDRTASENNIIIVPLDEVITEQAGEQAARKLGERYQADMVVWGWYAINDSQALFTLHIENMCSSCNRLANSSKMLQGQMPPVELQSFKLQGNLALQVGDLGLFFLGLTLHNTGEFQRALDIFQQLSVGESCSGGLISCGETHFYLGTDYLNLGNFEKALTEYTTALDGGTNLMEIHNNRGVVYASLMQNEAALKDFEEAIKYDSASNTREPIFIATVYNNLGWMQYLSGNEDQAVSNLKKSLDIDPDGWIARYNLGIIYGNRGDYDNAIKMYSQALQKNKQSDAAYTNRGIIYSKSKNHFFAIWDLSRAIQINPTADAYRNRSVAYAAAGLYYFALDDQSMNIQLNPNDYTGYFYRGNNYRGLGEYQKAIEDYTKAIALNPDIADVYSGRGIALANLNKSSEAIEDFSKAIALNPAVPEYYVDRGAAYYETGSYLLALADLTTALDLDSKNGRAFCILGLSYEKIDRLDLAKSNLETCLSLPGSSGLHELAQSTLQKILDR
jgi:tetratricopeptide (TPR) repeat protein